MPNPGNKAFNQLFLEDADGIGATDQAVMIVNIFPNDQTMTGLATRNITIEASALPFYSSFEDLPMFAEVPQAPVVDLVAAVDGSMVLKTGLAAAAVSMSLF